MGMELIKTETGLEVNFDCLLCGHNLQVDARGMGMEVPCPECGGLVVIPRIEPSMGERAPGVTELDKEEAPQKLRLSNTSHYGDKVRCAFCRQYMPSGAIVCSACGYDQVKRKRHRTVVRRNFTVHMPWGLVLACCLLLGFVYVVFYSARRPEIPRTRKLLEKLYETVRPASDTPSGGR